MDKKLISIVTPCYNEEANVLDVYNEVKRVFSELPNYSYEHIFIDNASADKTVEILKQIAEKDKNVKIIVNVKNFGHIKSPCHAMFQASGDAMVFFMCDLQDPADLIKEFVKKWEEGYTVALGVKHKSRENPIKFMLRKLYYEVMSRISETEQIKNFMGFGLYDRSFVDILRRLKEPYPYFRGLVAEFSDRRAEIPYTQQKRKKGKTKNSFYTLYDNAMLGIVNHSKVPLRIAIFLGFSVGIFSLLIAVVYFIYKLLYWDSFQVGAAPSVIGLFFFSAVQLIFIGVLGEYIGAIYTQVKDRPLVIEKERINFER